MSSKTIVVQLQQQADYRFQVSYGEGVPDLITDESVPLGSGQGPSPVQLLCTAVGNCLSDSLLFALRKFKQSPDPIRATVQAEVGRNEQGRMRVLSMHAELQLGVAAEQLEHLDRVLAQFEEFCTVTQSVGQGIAIATRVLDAQGRVLKS